MTAILHARILGKGNPLLILHGFLGSGDNWISLGRKFAEDKEVHLIDLRNHGRSFHDDELDYELMLNDVVRYCSRHKLKNIAVLGHSMGGKVAMYLAVKHPRLVHKLIVADIAPKAYPRAHDFILNALASIDFSKHKSRDLFNEILQKSIPDNAIRQFLLKNIYRKSKDRFAFRFNLRALTTNYSYILESLPAFSVFEKDTLFLKGEHSNYIQTGDIPLIKAHFPMAQIKTITNSGHWLHAENPDEFYSACKTFLH